MSLSITELATLEHPVRASSLPALMRCPWGWAMIQMQLERDEAGVAADTGSAVHEAARCWHAEGGRELAKALQSMKAHLNDFPFANLETASDHFLPYCRDVRNINAVIHTIGGKPALETEVKIQIAPDQTDKTQAPVVIVGHLDQIRRINGSLTLIDIKTGKPDGPDMVNDYTYQQAIYQYGASQLCGEPVTRAFILRTQDYLKRTPGPVFWECPWTLQQIPMLLRSVARAVARIRNGEIDPIPGKHCGYCPAINVGNCLVKLGTLNTSKCV